MDAWPYHRRPRRRAARVLVREQEHRPAATRDRARPQSTIGVGIIGVSPDRGWAASAHIPALRALPNYEIRALSGSTAESAEAAGEAFGVNAVFSDPARMVAQ